MSNITVANSKTSHIYNLPSRKQYEQYETELKVGDLNVHFSYPQKWKMLLLLILIVILIKTILRLDPMVIRIYAQGFTCLTKRLIDWRFFKESRRIHEFPVRRNVYLQARGSFSIASDSMLGVVKLFLPGCRNQMQLIFWMNEIYNFRNKRVKCTIKTSSRFRKRALFEKWVAISLVPSSEMSSKATATTYLPTS